MDFRIIYGVIFLLIISSGTIFAHGSESLISIQTNEKNYEEEDTIVISGNVTTIIGDTPITLQVFREGTLLEIAQITVAQDGTFSHTILAEGPLWTHEGEFITRASYGERDIAEAKFNYTPKSKLMETTNEFEVSIKNHGTFDIKYSIKGGILKDIIQDSDILGLKVEIDTLDDYGKITMELPREFIGAEKQNGKDEIFIVLIDGIEVPYQESIVNSESRIISIEFESGDSNIEIIGTYMIPEFGTITIVILMISILSTVVISRNKFQLKN
jgi:predicted secreted protein with PEFG-CTERM motif